jgi:hypothetical protein
MKVFTLPWPVEELRKLGNTMVTLRVALSSFIEPNPSEPARGSKFRYASHNLRFELQRANENESQFLARVSRASEQTLDSAVDTSVFADADDGWDFGKNRRNVGSLHIDQLSCRASDLARRNIIAVHPVAGWWKTKGIANLEQRSARFALVVEIDAATVEAELYAEVETAIEALTVVPIVA